MVTRLEQKKPDPLGLFVPVEQSDKTPGVLILSREQQVLYMSPSAKLLLHEMQDRDSMLTARDVLPRQITRFCDTLLDQLAPCTSVDSWGHVQVQQAVTTARQTILLRGWGLPADKPSAEHRLLLFFETVSDPSLSVGKHSGPPLSERQQAVVEGLIRGLTNKELADELRISEHTVKEYLRTIMLKVQATTRAGVIAKVLGLQSEQSASKKRSQQGALVARQSA